MGTLDRTVMRRLLGGVATCATLLLLVATARAQHDAPSAILKLTARSVAVGVGVSWGSGTLTYQGKDYKVGVKGFAVGGVGVTSAEASGKVYNLTKLADFDGSYTLLSTGVTAGAGTGAIAMSNPNGVTIELVSQT